MIDTPFFEQTPLFPEPLSNFGKSKFSQLLRQGWLLAESNPQILEMIKSDQILHGLEKKKCRAKDTDFLLKKQGKKALLKSEEKNINELALTESKHRMPAQLVLIFILLRGFFGGLKSQQLAWTIEESITLHKISVHLGLKKVPGLSTIVENLNALNETTLRSILEISISEAKKKNWTLLKKYILTALA